MGTDAEIAEHGKIIFDLTGTGTILSVLTPRWHKVMVWRSAEAIEVAKKSHS